MFACDFPTRLPQNFTQAGRKLIGIEPQPPFCTLQSPLVIVIRHKHCNCFTQWEEGSRTAVADWQRWWQAAAKVAKRHSFWRRKQWQGLGSENRSAKVMRSGA